MSQITRLTDTRTDRQTGRHTNRQIIARPRLHMQRCKRCEIGYKLVLFTNRKPHTDFRLVLTSVTLNNLDRRSDRRRALHLR